MQTTNHISQILSNYESDSPGVRANLYRILSHGKLGGTGKLLILPVDQGFEHGPVRSFAMNPDAYDPLYHYSLAIEAGLSAYAAPLGMLELGAHKFAGQIPTILKMNSATLLRSKSLQPEQILTGSVKDALRLGCSAVGFTVYPGSNAFKSMVEQVRDVISEAKSVGLPTVIWSYPRGGDLSQVGETALDICAYSAHMAALCGAHIIKVKLPTEALESPDSKATYEKYGIDASNLAARVKHIKQACFNGKRLVVFSGGTSKNLDDLYTEVRAINQGGGDGSIVGRNTFQRPRADALKMLDTLIKIYSTQGVTV
jgi:class I fructose-bisphosphate aldolase